MFAFTLPIDTLPVKPRTRLRLPAVDPVASGDDEIVRLRPDWPALMAMTRFAGRATWLFGHRVAVLECVEPRTRPCARRGEAGDPTCVRFNFKTWTHAVARRRAASRQIEFYAGSGAAIATLCLDQIDPVVDELVWLLIDDENLPVPKLPHADGNRRGLDTPAIRRALKVIERREDFERVVAMGSLRRHDAFALAGPHVATALPSNALDNALDAAVGAGVRLRVRLENAGGSVSWTPAEQCLSRETSYVELRSAYGRAHLSRRIGPTWLVHLAGSGYGGPSIEAESVIDGGWVHLEAAGDFQRDAWRNICSALAKSS
jgi:putative heme degradation protein